MGASSAVSPRLITGFLIVNLEAELLIRWQTKNISSCCRATLRSEKRNISGALCTQNGHEVLYSGDDAMGRMEGEMGEGGMYLDSIRPTISRSCA